METSYPLTTRLRNLNRFKLGVVLLLVSVLASPALNLVFTFVPADYDPRESEGIPPIFYIMDLCAFLILIVYAWSILNLSHRPMPEDDSTAYSRIRRWARVAIVVALLLHILTTFGSIKMMALADYGSDPALPGWWRFSSVVSILSRVSMIVCDVLALLCLGYLEGLTQEAKLFRWNRALIWAIVISDLFATAVRLHSDLYYWLLYWDLNYFDRALFSLMRTLGYCSSGLGWIVLVFTTVILILFLRFIGRARRDMVRMQKKISRTG